MPSVHGAFTERPLLVTFSAYGALMREAFHDQLDSIFHDLAEICGEVEAAVRNATGALLEGNAEVAEAVIAADAKIDRARERVEDTAFSLLSLQQPVAGDLRVVVSALRMVSELERMGDLSVHVAKIARLRVPEIAVPVEARPTIARMGEVAEDMVRRVAAVILERDVEAAIALGRDDEEERCVGRRHGEKPEVTRAIELGQRRWFRGFLYKFSLCFCVSVVILLSACSRKPDPNTLVMIIESSPINLDPRVGVDGAIAAHRRAAVRLAASPRRPLQPATRTGRALGNFRSADLCLSSAAGRALS